MFEDFKVFETEVAGRKLSIETGKMAQLANGAVLVRYGEQTCFAPPQCPTNRVRAWTFSRFRSILKKSFIP